MRYRVDLDRALAIEASSVEEARSEALQALAESPDLLSAYEDRDRAAELHAEQQAGHPTGDTTSEEER